MNVINRRLTLNEDAAGGTVECISGCRVELTPFEVASFVTGNSFTLSCRLRANDPGEGSDEVLFTYPTSRTFQAAVDLLGMDHVFRATVSRDLLDEDNGTDEIRAHFTLVNNATGQRRIRATVTEHLDE